MTLEKVPAILALMESENWSDKQNDAIIADYFAMLADDLAQRPYNKAAHNRGLQPKIGRSRGAIEYKHQNISAVLKALGLGWITGYKPAFNFQMSLVDAVVRWMVSNPERTSRQINPTHSNHMFDPATLYVGLPPAMRNTPPPDELDKMMSIAGKFNVAERDEKNRTLGLAGEKCVLAYEKSRLVTAGKPELAERVRWVSQEDGDGAGFDIASFSLDGCDRLIEVKTTSGWERTPFHISRNELSVAATRRNEWRLLRVWNFNREPRAFEIRPPLDAHVTLTPTSFQASFH